MFEKIFNNYYYNEQPITVTLINYMKNNWDYINAHHFVDKVRIKADIKDYCKKHSIPFSVI